MSKISLIILDFIVKIQYNSEIKKHKLEAVCIYISSLG